MNSLSVVMVFFTVILAGCQNYSERETVRNTHSLFPNELEDSANTNSMKENYPSVTDGNENFPRYPRIGKGYKFLAMIDTIHYVLLIERVSDSTLEYQTDNDIRPKMRYGIAKWNCKIYSEKSVLNNNVYKAFEYLETTDSVITKIRIGIDRLGSGDRILVHFIEERNNRIYIDLNMAN